MEADASGAAILVKRRLEWKETDASGHHHFTAAFRWMEEAEHQLLANLGLSKEVIDRLPRVHIEIDYTERLVFGDELTIRVAVMSVGRTSCTFTYTVDKAGTGRAIAGSYTIVHASSTTVGAAPWPAEIRDALLSGVEFAVAPQTERYISPAVARDAELLRRMAD